MEIKKEKEEKKSGVPGRVTIRGRKELKKQQIMDLQDINFMIQILIKLIQIYLEIEKYTK